MSVDQDFCQSDQRDEVAYAPTPKGCEDLAETTLDDLSRKMEVGDIVFIRVKPLPFRKVAAATNSWTNHVGIVIDVSGPEPIIGESTFPFSKATLLWRFIARSENGRVGVRRLNERLAAGQRQKLIAAAQKRFGVFYDTGFNLHSKGQFCSRFVYEVIREVMDIKVGEVENFSTLLNRNPAMGLTFWKIWYFGRIPWERTTVTPASLFESPALHNLFDGKVVQDDV